MVSGIFFFCIAVKDAFISSTLVPGGALSFDLENKCTLIECTVFLCKLM